MPSVILTTAGNLPNDQRYEIIDVITSECVMGMNVFRDVFAGVRDFFGGGKSMLFLVASGTAVRTTSG